MLAKLRAIELERLERKAQALAKLDPEYEPVMAKYRAQIEALSTEKLEAWFDEVYSTICERARAGKTSYRTSHSNDALEFALREIADIDRKLDRKSSYEEHFFREKMRLLCDICNHRLAAYWRAHSDVPVTHSYGELQFDWN